jgi:hypothetical protein
VGIEKFSQLLNTHPAAEHNLRQAAMERGVKYNQASGQLRPFWRRK